MRANRTCSALIARSELLDDENKKTTTARLEFNKFPATAAASTRHIGTN